MNISVDLKRMILRGARRAKPRTRTALLFYAKVLPETVEVEDTVYREAWREFFGRPEWPSYVPVVFPQI